MARIRSIKPTFARSRSVKRLNSDQKLVWICLWPLADDQGRLIDEPEQLLGDLWALSFSAAKIHRLLDDLAAEGRIVRYRVAGQAYIQVTNWAEHQKISKPTASLIPPVELREDSGSAPGGLPRGKGKERKGEEGRGGLTAEPPMFCSSHPAGTSDRCGACADARRIHTAWSKLDHTPVIQSPPKVADLFCPNHPGMPPAGCERCAEEQAVAS